MAKAKKKIKKPSKPKKAAKKAAGRKTAYKMRRVNRKSVIDKEQLRKFCMLFPILNTMLKGWKMFTTTLKTEAYK